MNQLSEVLLESASRTLAGATGESGHSRTRGAGAWAVAAEISMDWTDVKLTVATVAQDYGTLCHYVFQVFFFFETVIFFEIHQRGGWVGGEEKMIVKEM